ncbi:hypothetical protein PG993_010726 [Apiospora rasikravindrae]|uniref:Ribosomal RNA methyltransferase FtsJ domain-containing protein n=1 Tax=Apiospora rasikravindrae TaxID=990691 RepID=A0ABR1SC42_9PEZI
MQGWKNPKGDEFFRNQRQRADRPSENTAVFFYKMMQKIGHEIHKATNAFLISSPKNGKPRILDMCVAPGGFLATALRFNPEAEAVGFSLPVSMGGHKMRMPESDRVRLTYVDITMLAGDMGLGADDIPPGHPDHDRFVLQRQLTPRPSPSEGQEDLFDLCFCDGQVLRTHQRADYREKREARRLITTQLALALGHLRPGGTMVVLLHKVSAWDTTQLLHTFNQFAKVQLFKSRVEHAKRSSFYMVATQVQSRSEEAVGVVQRWRQIWRVATFGTDEEYTAALRESLAVERVLEEFGMRLIELGEPIWVIQAQALAKAPFMRYWGPQRVMTSCCVETSEAG